MSRPQSMHQDPDLPTTTMNSRQLQSALKAVRLTEGESISPDGIIEKVQYKGFVNCDHPTRKPNEYTLDGMHEIFTNKRQMKAAQLENPLAGRGFKKPVILMCQYDGFRLDMFSKKEEGALLHASINKVVIAKAIERFVYIILKRGNKDGKYACHCIQVESKNKEMPAFISDFLNESIKNFDDEQQSQTLPVPSFGRGVSIRDDEEVARLRKKSTAFVENSSLVEDSTRAYLSDSPTKPTHDASALTAKDRDAVQAMLDDTSAQLNKINLESKPWYHGDIDRSEADCRLDGLVPGTFLIRIASDKKNYSLSLVILDRRIRHFKVVNTGDGRWCIQGHANSYQTVSSLVMHYSEADITQEGDRCGAPCICP